MGAAHSFLKQRWYQVLVGFLSLVALAISLIMARVLMADIDEDTDVSTDVLHFDYKTLRQVIIALLLLLILLHMIQCFVTFRESKILFLKHVIYSILSGDAAVLLAFNSDTPRLVPAACFLYVLAVFIDCVLELIRKKSKWNIMLLIIMLFVIYLSGSAALIPYLDLDIDQEVGTATLMAVEVLFFVVDIQGVASIMPMAFSSIRMDILKKIIKKTYAAEILFGIILLIVAFSFILPVFEPGIDNFWDSLWYCFALVTTIGFGDITATSGIGRILSVILGLYGIIVVSLITSIIVNFYGEMQKEEKDNQRKSDEDPADERPRAEGYYDERPRMEGYYDGRPRMEGYYDGRPRMEGGYDEKPRAEGSHDERPRMEDYYEGYYYDERPREEDGYDESPRGDIHQDD